MQYWQRFAGIDPRRSGKLSEISALQLEKAAFPICWNFKIHLFELIQEGKVGKIFTAKIGGKITSVRFLQSLKAPSPISVTAGEIITLKIFEQP
jgi:hypothetical protein